MRIAFLSTFYPFRGGIAQFNASMYAAFKLQGHEVKAFTFTTQYPNFLFPGKSQFVEADSEATKIASRRVLSSVNPLSYIKTAKEIRAFQPDLLIMKFWLPFFGPSLGYVASRLKKRSTVITILDNVVPHEKRFFDTAFARYFLKQNHAFVAMSDAVKRDLLALQPNAVCGYREHPLYDHFGKSLKKEEAQKRLHLDPKKKCLLFFGLIRKYKGLDLLIEAFNELDDSYQLLIAGESYEPFDYYQKKIDNNRNRDRIHIHNRYIDDAEVPTFFSAADVVVLPYKSATQSGITAIAFHFELPVIATDVGGLKEIVQHNKYGLVVEKPASSAVKSAIEQFYQEELSVPFKTNIIEKKKECSWANFADHILALKERVE